VSTAPLVTQLGLLGVHMQNLEELIKRAEKQMKCGISFKRSHLGPCDVVLCNGTTEQDLMHVNYERAIDRLKELATPKFVTVTFPVKDAKEFAMSGWGGTAGKISDYIQAELDKLELP
jgi:hypothetical protein